MSRVFSCTGGMHKIYDPEFYKVVFFSSAPIGLPFLEKLHEDKRFEVTGVVTMPDAPAGRGMKMQENIIKTKAKEMFDINITSNVILLHGKDTDPSKKRYPQFIAAMKEHKIPVYAPSLPHADNPILSEWIDELEKGNPDENSILVGHSRGGVAILRWLEKLPKGKKIQKVILVATNGGERKNSDDKNDFFSEIGYDFTKIRQHCDNFTVYHSQDDKRVDFADGEKIAQGLNATFYRYENKGHFGKDLGKRGFPEIVDEILKKKKKNIILLHGFGGRPDKNFLPSLKKELEMMGHSVSAPLLPHPDDLAFEEKIDFVLKHCMFDENTIIVGHSLGSLVAMKAIEKLSNPIAGFICIGGMFDRRVTPQRKKLRANKYKDYDVYKKSYGPIVWDEKLLKENCKQFLVLSDPNDTACPKGHQEKLAAFLNALLVQEEPEEEHFCGSHEPIINQFIKAFIEKIDNADEYIQTPNSLRLDSKKYANEAQQFQQRLAAKKPDFLVVIAYGKIIPQYILDIPTFGPINVHGSILPKYRGASPIQSVFLHGEEETGITIMKMDAGLDTGDMIDINKFPIAFDWTAKNIITKMQEIGPQFLVDTLRKYGKGLLGEVKQDDAQATHCGKIEKEDGLIDPYKDSIETIYQKYRAYILWPKIYFMHNEKRVIVEELALDKKLFAQHNKEPLLSSVIPSGVEGSHGRNKKISPLRFASLEMTGGQEDHANNQINPCITTLTVKPEGSKSQSRDDFVKGYM